jgi:hypothetical protein
MKRISITLLILIIIKYSYSQTNELNFNFQRINFSAAPRTAISPMSIKLWDSYNNGGPTSYGTVLELYGLGGHQTSQLNFGGWDNSKIRYREAFYNQNTWSDWITLLDSKNDVESLGNLRISGTGAHYILNGNVGIGTTNPKASLDILKTATINGNDIIANFQRTSSETCGSGIVRLGIHNTADLEINSGYTNTGYRFGSYFDFNIVNNKLGGDHGAINLVTNGATRMVINPIGNIGIGTTSPAYKLDVLGTIRAKEVLVNLDGGADFVFEKDYKLPTIEHVATYVQENKHLPDIPSANEMVKNGVSMGDMQVKLLQKVEELTLYVIEQQKQINQLKQELKK